MGFIILWWVYNSGQDYKYVFGIAQPDSHSLVLLFCIVYFKVTHGSINFVFADYNFFPYHVIHPVNNNWHILALLLSLETTIESEFDEKNRLMMRWSINKICRLYSLWIFDGVTVLWLGFSQLDMNGCALVIQWLYFYGLAVRDIVLCGW